MAGEYSRELSAKVFKGQCRLIQLGYRQGGAAGFGLRRVLIDQSGSVKGELARGEHKSIQTDRVILTPGPTDEIKTVRWIFTTFVDDRKQEREIASILNERGIKSDLGRPWTRATIHQILTNEKYIGNNVYNRISFKLKKKRVRNPPDTWVRSEGVFDAVVDARLFYMAQGIIMERCRRYSDQDLLERLKKLYETHGRLTGLIIDEQDDHPSSSIYMNRFGSLIRAYQMVGYVPDRDYQYLEINRRLREMHPNTVQTVLQRIETVGGQVERDEMSDLLTINREFSASLVIARCSRTSGGSYRWNIRLDAILNPDITVAVRMDETNEAALDYYLLPRIDISAPKLRLAESNGLYFDAYRFDTLDYLFSMAKRTAIEEVA